MTINHVNIVVQDLERSLAFYEGTLGLKRVFEETLSGEWFDNLTNLNKAQARCVFLEDGASGTRIELLQFTKPMGGIVPNNSLANTHGLRHLAFEVEDVDAHFEKVLLAGIPVKSEPVDVPFSVLGKSKRLFYVVDPDGVIIEFCSMK